MSFECKFVLMMFPGSRPISMRDSRSLLRYVVYIHKVNFHVSFSLDVNFYR